MESVLLACSVPGCIKPRQKYQVVCPMHRSRFWRTGVYKRQPPHEQECGFCREMFLNESGSRKTKYCPVCRKKKWKIYKKTKNWEHSEKGRAYSARFHKENREKYKKQVYDHYGWLCKCCAESRVSMLTVDHVNNDGFLDRRSKLSGASFYKKIISQDFPDSYQILCMNCNWSKRILKGICEHQAKKLG